MSFDDRNGNTSGKGPDYPVPDAVARKFNWGAFLFSWIWGLGNHTFIVVFLAAFMITVNILVNVFFGQDLIILTMFGIVGLLMSILFGIEGNRWAWQNKHFDSIEHFHKNQKKWVIAWFILVFGPSILIMVAAFVFGAAAMFTMMPQMPH